MNLYQQLLSRHQPLCRDTRSAVGCAPNGTGTIELQVGPTYQSIEIITNNIPKTKVKFRLELNGEPIVVVSGSDLVMRQNYKGNHVEDGRYIIDFACPNYRTKNGIRSGELVTLDTDILTLYIELADVVDGWSIRGRAWITAAQPARYFVPKIFSLNYDAMASGDNDYIWPNRSQTRFIRRLHFKASNIEKLTMYRDDTKRHEVRAADNNFDLTLHGLAPQSGYFHFDPGQLGFGLDGLLPTAAAKELKFVLNKAAPGTVPVLVEMLEQVAQIPTAAA
ncbi:major capsid protein P2 [Ferrimonas balearica]|uniref:major capsid protein P2 n=1 Tax=Ferrimonas balearica TaxID=44012 RepID=UPI001F18CB45|nr:major capsid protein P2 [Ferrimonas balearica]MBY6095130.1 hypothetical protein [Ferrimonas balearica]